MTPIQSDNYAIYFNDASFVYLENLLKTETYSKIFVLADENTNEHCLPYFLANLPTEIEIEIIEMCTALQSIFQVHIEDPYRIFIDIANRKTVPMKFIPRLEEGFLRKVNEVDGMN